MKLWRVTITGGGAVHDYRVMSTTIKGAVNRALANTYDKDPKHDVQIVVEPATESLLIELEGEDDASMPRIVFTRRPSPKIAG